MSVTDSDSVAQDQLQSFVRRIEALEDEIGALNGDKSEVYKEAKGNGFDTKVLRKVIADRRKDASERNEFDEVYQLYWDAIHGVVRAHVENIEEFDRLKIEPLPEHDADGVIIEPTTTNGGEHENAAADPAVIIPGRRRHANGGNAHDAAAVETDELQRQVNFETHNEPAEGSAEETSATNITQLHKFNPATHFANSKGLPRLHGCLKPDACGGSHRALCHSCARASQGSAA